VKDKVIEEFKDRGDNELSDIYAISNGSKRSMIAEEMRKRIIMSQEEMDDIVDKVIDEDDSVPYVMPESVDMSEEIDDDYVNEVRKKIDIKVEKKREVDDAISRLYLVVKEVIALLRKYEYSI